MRCLNCQREDSRIIEGEPIIAEFCTFNGTVFRGGDFMGGVWHVDCAKALGLAAGL